jgi:predicted molibdopterin-dependent oxidoreductase YjgC
VGVGKGTCSLDDFEHADLILVVGQNPATNHPRMMGALHEAAARGVRRAGRKHDFVAGLRLIESALLPHTRRWNHSDWSSISMSHSTD